MNFNELVKSIVEPILFHFDFILKEEIPGIMKYDHKVLSISISYDYRRSYEVGVTFSFKANGIFYGYEELKEYYSNQKFNFYTATQLTKEEDLKKWLNGVEKFLKDNLPSIIKDHKEVCNGLERIIKRQSDEYERNRNDRILREGVDKYWANKDYAGLVKFLEKYNGQFEGSIKKKYEYALKMNNGK